MEKSEITTLIQKHFDVLADEYGVSRIGIFGSAIKGEMADGSDVDLLVEFNRPIGFKFSRLVDYLENIFGKRVDLMTKAGLENIRVKGIARDIQRNLTYIEARG
jgi:predicted nucleotidyltransferase